MSEIDEIQISYFVLCDQVITEAQTGKQSLIGIYSAMMSDQFPFNANIAAALGLRVQSARPRELSFHFSGPDGERLFTTPPLPYDWNSVAQSVQSAGFAIVQIGVNIRAMPFTHPGLYTAAIYSDGAWLISTTLAVSQGIPPGMQGTV